MLFSHLQFQAGSEAAARDTFERLITDLVAVDHPSANEVSGPGGSDWGMDTYLGRLDDVLTVWQSKFLLDWKGEYQRGQVRDSFEKLIAKADRHNFRVREWTLCIPCVLPPWEQQWFDKWAREREALHNIRINLWNGVVLRRLLARDESQAVLAQYFPQFKDDRGEVRLSPGKPILDWNPLSLEVHTAIQLDVADSPQNALPLYVRRSHDGLLKQIAEDAESGSSRMVVLIGGSATGKTRACWEAVQRLGPHWRLWHPIFPGRVQALLRDIANVEPHTVVWLNELQEYLPDGDSGSVEQVASGIRELLDDPDRAPVLVLGTIWPELWKSLTIPSPGGRVRRGAQVQALLANRGIAVAEAFFDADLEELGKMSRDDARLTYAARHAEGGRITQQLAGIPELVQRYTHAPPTARALIQVAMDARRLGLSPAIGHDLLADAAPSYLSDHEWQQATDDWFAEAIGYLAAPCHGTPGPLTPIRPRPTDRRSPTGRPSYRLADFLDEVGRTMRRFVVPPEDFWTSAATHVEDPIGLSALAVSADRRLRLRQAHLLRQAAAQRLSSAVAAATAAGDMGRIQQLYYHSLREKDSGETHRMMTMLAEAGDPQALVHQTVSFVSVGDLANAERAAVRAARAGEPSAMNYLHGQISTDDPAEGERVATIAASFGNFGPLLHQADEREYEGDTVGATSALALAAEAGNRTAMIRLARLHEDAGATSTAEHFAQKAAIAGNAEGLSYLALQRASAGNEADAERLGVLAAEAGDHTALNDLALDFARAGRLADGMRLTYIAAHLDSTTALRRLMQIEEGLGDYEEAERLARLAADIGDVDALRDLASQRQAAAEGADADQLLSAAANAGNGLATADLIRRHVLEENWAEAERLAEQDDSGVGYHIMLVNLYKNAGQFSRAEQFAVRVGAIDLVKGA